MLTACQGAVRPGLHSRGQLPVSRAVQLRNCAQQQFSQESTVQKAQHTVQTNRALQVGQSQHAYSIGKVAARVHQLHVSTRQPAAAVARQRTELLKL